ncbi:MAG: aldehyde dehydrogenase [Candidatus Sungbacteria bacterium]|nr:aldehyde dehydrogenase [Candidatus Sungbacteria bacterium]
MNTRHANMVIDGRLRRGTGQEFPVHNPATGKIIGTARDATLAEIKEAFDSAQEAWKYWHLDFTPLQVKEQVFQNMWEELHKARYSLAWDMAEECGKTIEECEWDVQEAMDTYRHYAGEVSRIHGRLDEAQLKNKERKTIRMPYGVVGCSIPFNFPLGIFSWKTGGAIAGGNAIVMKDAEQTPFSAVHGARLFLKALAKETGGRKSAQFKRLRGLLNLLHGRGDSGGKTGVNLVEYGDYDLFVFTGGVETGRKIGAVCGRRLKPFHPELGGHARMVLLSDYIEKRGLKKAVGEVIRGCMGTNAQRCVTTRGGFVEKEYFWQAVTAHMEMALTWKIGDPQDPRTQFGPLIEESSVQKCEEVVAELAKRGYYPIIGGFRLGPDTLTFAKEHRLNLDPDDFKTGGRLSKGNFFAPTLYVNIPHDARPMQEEIFGPIFFYNEIPQVRASELSEFSHYILKEHLEIYPSTLDWQKMAHFLYAIELINQSQYGLSNSVLTTDLTEAWLASRLIRSGITYIGRGTTGAEVPGKFGGFKNSGWGRDGEGIEDYTWEKTIWTDIHPTVRMAQTGSFEKLEAWVRTNKTTVPVQKESTAVVNSLQEARQEARQRLHLFTE